ncbi:DUF262 domain-containing protein [Herbaspirillum seropedicae]|uniref:DUF262 domain-containing protein n=1 Tax=Herbaspirillum seropedicae TaxID=964 RepID=UPI00285A6BB1|nr:DUF262 domain-containing protein [Herbaspirillum seropedicae]MDR6394262.1 hypothetical protein [Herbaspirillum seropedicae]
MNDELPIFEIEDDRELPDPDEVPVRDRRVYTQPYDLVVDSLIEQISAKTIFLRPLSDRPDFQRKYVWSDFLASRLIESILLNVPIPPCYLSQNENFELDVIDGQQRIFSIFRFISNQFALQKLEVLKELNDLRFHEIPQKYQRQLKTHTLRCVVITNESHPEIKFDVFERLNSNTVPLNAQELRNCIYRGDLNSLIKKNVEYLPWLSILGKKKPDMRMRDEELVLRFYAFYMSGIQSYRTPQKHWLNDVAKTGQKLSPEQLENLEAAWKNSINVCLTWFDAKTCFRRGTEGKSRVINRTLFDLLMIQASKISVEIAQEKRADFLERFAHLMTDVEFSDLIGRAVDHTRRTKRRFEIWERTFEGIFKNA